jgi:hypothetical protein
VHSNSNSNSLHHNHQPETDRQIRAQPASQPARVSVVQIEAPTSCARARAQGRKEKEGPVSFRGTRTNLPLPSRARNNRQQTTDYKRRPFLGAQTQQRQHCATTTTTHHAPTRRPSRHRHLHQIRSDERSTARLATTETRSLAVSRSLTGGARARPTEPHSLRAWLSQSASSHRIVTPFFLSLRALSRHQLLRLLWRAPFVRSTSVCPPADRPSLVRPRPNRGTIAVWPTTPNPPARRSASQTVSQPARRALSLAAIPAGD